MSVAVVLLEGEAQKTSASERKILASTGSAALMLAPVLAASSCPSVQCAGFSDRHGLTWSQIQHCRQVPTEAALLPWPGIFAHLDRREADFVLGWPVLRVRPWVWRCVGLNLQLPPLRWLPVCLCCGH